MATPNQRLVLHGLRRFDPLQWFANGEQGLWLDSYDFSTMYQDSTGSTPVTALGQSVGLILDKSKRLALGASPITNGGFDTDTVWTKDAGCTIAGSEAVFTAVASGLGFTQSTLTSGLTYIVSMVVSAVTSGSLQVSAGTTLGPAITAPGTYQCILTAASADLLLRSSTAGTTASVSSVTVTPLAGNHASQPTSNSRPTLQQDAAGRYYLNFDGFDDFLVTPNVDFSGTDKVTVVSGIYKGSDSAPSVVLEFSASSATNNGSFTITAPNTATANFGLRSKGTTLVSAVSASSYAAPISAVVTGIGEISTPLAQVRVNGTAASVTTTQGTGAFGTYPFYVGRRGGIAAPFTGHVHGLIVRGVTSTTTEIAKLETWMNSRTGAY